MNLAGADRSLATVRVKFMGDLPSLTGKRNLELTLPHGSTLADLFASLSKRFGDDFSRRVFSSPSRLRHTMLVFVDGEHIKHRGGLAAVLEDSEVEVIMLPMFGGG